MQLVCLAMTEDESDEINKQWWLLTQINLSLSSSKEAGPPASDKLPTIVNEKFQTEYTADKRKEMLKKYKVLSVRVRVNCNQLFVSKVNPEIWEKLSASSQ